jgi:hypothetical protein
MSNLLHLRQRERLQERRDQVYDKLQRRIGELEGDEIAAVLPEQE